jgi:hypothetical protein
MVMLQATLKEISFSRNSSQIAGFETLFYADLVYPATGGVVGPRSFAGVFKKRVSPNELGYLRMGQTGSLVLYFDELHVDRLFQWASSRDLSMQCFAEGNETLMKVSDFTIWAHQGPIFEVEDARTRIEEALKIIPKKKRPSRQR